MTPGSDTFRGQYEFQPVHPCRMIVAQGFLALFQPGQRLFGARVEKVQEVPVALGECTGARVKNPNSEKEGNPRPREH
jgi:hypothetical protein